MRILFLASVATVGGAESVLLDLIASLKPVLPPGSSMHLICPSEGPLIQAASSLGTTSEIIALPLRMLSVGESGLGGTSKIAKAGTLAVHLALMSPQALRYIRQLRRAAKRFGADIVHSNGLKMHLISRLLGRRAGPVLWHVHDLIGVRPLMAGNLRFAAGRLSGAVAISKAVAEDLKQVLPRTRVFTVLNGLDTRHFRPAESLSAVQNPLDQLAGLPPADRAVIRIGLVATYARWKGQDVFLQAAARLGDLPDLRFYIIGGSIYSTAGSQYSVDELRGEATALGLNDRVGFIGFQTDPAPIYQALDIVAHCSTKPEPFGRTIIEAMACGKAVIVSAAGGAAELFTDNVDAIGTMPGNVEQLAEAIRRLVQSPDLRNQLGQNARHTACARFDRARLGPEMLAVYRQVAESLTSIV